ncbi:hypothetical protein [Arenibaculum pallidiluteum]|uniref:hypothetical protein n=1 Tax=Arenibaculum pallidiluteum TaxID=2812559 RepID=UPI001A96960B|nr:hypothetical protein [Arenibaculum pallidiluteum]
MAPPEAGRRPAAALCAAMLELDGIGHMMMLEAADRLSDALARWFPNASTT